MASYPADAPRSAQADCWAADALSYLKYGRVTLAHPVYRASTAI
jgi:hypothetical protein